MHFLVALAVAAALPDRGIFPDLDPQVTTNVPYHTDAARTWLRLDPTHGVVTLYQDDDPLKAYPAAFPPVLSLPPAVTTVGALNLRGGDPKQPSLGGVTVRADDLAELGRWLAPASAARRLVPGRTEDRDGDGIVDRIDIHVGAKKLLFNNARYIDRYVSMRYPGGDVPRTEGVCSDTVIRALRNAGIDLQKEVHEDILAARRTYSMVEKIDSSINHRRVKTLLPWFQRHWTTLPKNTRYLPGDVVFFDTFPRRSGPDHLGVVSDTITKSDLPAVVNNWTEGAVDAEMDLLSWVPVTHHFRARAPALPK